MKPRLLVITGSVCVALLLCGSAPSAAADPRPNVIFIMADDQDPAESINLAEQHPDIAARLRKLHESHLD